jgi:hypothetical protein
MKELVVLQKECKCGQTMNICLRSVIYQGKVEIAHVPVLTCESCSRSEVFAAVKPDMTKLISQLGNKPEKQYIRFEEISEISHLMVTVTDKEHRHESVGVILEERINELLDMLLLARSLQDDAWKKDVTERLSQITRYAMSTYEMKL